MGTHRRDVRPRYGRIGAATSAVVVTAVAMLAGFGLFPSSATSPPPRERPAANAPGSVEVLGAEAVDAAIGVDIRNASTPGERRRIRAEDLLPADSGSGRRVVYSEAQQRVWLVGENGRVRHTHLVSGSVYDNLEPGTFQVYSRSMSAIGIDDSGTMKYFVRFTQGDTGAAIGFHDIPVKDGQKVQGVDELGTATSHGCIRQKRSDARVMWRFADLGTPVVVTG
ncbi:L,D-transpeptidase [Nocardioides sp.]|uniref:L,D-transpeptidase n=1 Tax=Nocardioides sp. TaxID=35761 RepID=UPI002ED4CC8B